MPHVVIQTEGVRGKVFVDGNEIKGIRSVSFHLSSINECPVVHFEMIATDLTIDAKKVSLELPDVYKPFYQLKESTEMAD